MSEDLNKLDGYLIMKRGLYYRPNSCGYTGIRDNAGRYTLAEAQEHADPISGVTFVHESEAEEFSDACYDNLARDHLRAQVTDLRQRLQAAEERAEKVEGAWSWLASNTNLELDHRYLDEDDHGGTWQVHRVNGNVNDREWTLVAQARTPLEAILAARAAALVNGEGGE